MSFNLPLLASASNAQQSSPKGYGLDKFHTPSKFSTYVTQATQPDAQDYVMARSPTMRPSLLPSNMALREPQSPYSNKYTEKSPLFGNTSSPDRRMQNDEDAMIYQAKRSIQETIMSNRASQARLINYSDPPPMFPKLSQNLQKSSDYSPEKPSKLPLIDAQPKRSIRVPNTLIVPNFDSPQERPSLKPRIIEVEAHEATPYHQKHKSLEPFQPLKPKFEEKPYIPKKLSFNMDTETQLQDLKKNGALVNLKKMDNLRKAETEESESESEEEDEDESPEDSPFNVITDGSPTTVEKPQTGPLQVPTRFIGGADVYDTYNPLVKEAVVAEPRPLESIEEEDHTAISAKKLAVRMSRIQDMGFRRSTLINNAGGMSPSSHSMPPPISEKPEPRASIVERKLKIQQRRERAAVEDQIEKNRIAEKSEFIKRRGRARRRVGKITWIMLAIKLFYEAKKKRVRRKTLVFKKEVIDKMVSNVELAKNYLIKMVGQDILKILMNKEHEFIFVRNKKLKEHDQDLVCLAYTEQFKAVFKTLLENVKYIPPPFLLFLSRISKEECFIPDGFFSDFELQRLRFSLMGVLLRVSPGQSKLIIGGIILIRVLIYTIIMQPWYCFGKNKDEFDMNKLLNIGSVLYIASMDMFKDMAPVVQNDERLALLNVKVSAKQKPLLAIADPSVANKFDIKKDNNKEGGDIMTGFYAKTQLGVFFSERRRLTFELKNTMNEWLDGVLEQVKNCKKVEIKEEKGNITVQTGSGTVKKPSNGTIKKSTFKKQSEKQAKEAKAN